MVSLAAVVDTALFKEMKLEFREVVVDNEPTLEVLDAKNYEALLQGQGPVEPRLRGACRAVQALAAAEEIFLLLAKGRNVQFIRDELVLSTPTVKSHIYNIYQKMGVHSHQGGADRSGGERREGRLKPAGAGMPWAEAVLARRRPSLALDVAAAGRSLRTPASRHPSAGEHAPLTGHFAGFILLDDGACGRFVPLDA